MPMTRIDPFWVADDAGNRVWMPSADALLGPLGSTGQGLPMKPGEPDAIQMPPDFVGTPPDLGDMPPDYAGRDPQREAQVARVTGQDIEMPPDFVGTIEMPPEQLPQGVQRFADPALQANPVAGDQPRKDFKVPVDVIGAERGDAGAAFPVDPYGDTPAGMVDQRAPGNPYGRDPVAPLPGVPGSAAEGYAQENAALAQSQRLTRDAAEAKFKSEQSLASRQAGVDERLLREQDENERVRQREHAMAEAKADRETEDFLRKQEALAKTKTDPSRYWHSISESSRAMWMLGLIFSSAAAGADQSRNVVLKMLSDSVDQDIAGQEREISRQMDAMKDRGQSLRERQARAMKEVGDRAEGRFQRLQALRARLASMAKVPGQEQKAAAYAEVDSFLANQQMDVVAARRAAAVQKEAADVERKFQERQAAIARGHAAAMQKERIRAEQDAARQAHIWAVEDREDRQTEARAMAPVSLGITKAPSRSNPGGEEGKDFFTIPAGPGGFVLKHPDGTKESVRVPAPLKEVVAQARDEGEFSGKLIDAVKAVENTDWAGAYLGNDARLKSAVVGIIRPFAKTQDPGGKISDSDANDASRAVFGVDFDSAIALAKGPSRDEVVKLLKAKIVGQQEAAARRIAVSRGIDLEGGDVIEYVPPKGISLPDDPKAPTAAEQHARWGYDASPGPVTTIEDAKDRQSRMKSEGLAPGDVYRKLPDDLTKIIEETSTRLVSAPQAREQTIKKAQEALAAWQGSQPVQTPEQANAIGSYKLEADRRIFALADELAASTSRLDEVVATGKVLGGGSLSQTTKIIRDGAKKAKLTLTEEEARQAAIKALEDLPESLRSK